eukprot:GHVN01098152.1.p1 GENE.GHVN01098152.1~~GHVN01098152.1.p1  ORF type:complete len:195 (+),score=47.93 GHVN01098152.1:374-958(+)
MVGRCPLVLYEKSEYATIDMVETMIPQNGYFLTTPHIYAVTRAQAAAKRKMGVGNELEDEAEKGTENHSEREFAGERKKLKDRNEEEIEEEENQSEDELRSKCREGMGGDHEMGCEEILNENGEGGGIEEEESDTSDGYSTKGAAWTLYSIEEFQAILREASKYLASRRFGPVCVDGLKTHTKLCATDHTPAHV